MNTGVKGARRVRLASTAFCVWLFSSSCVTFAQTPQEQAWEVLHEGLTDQNTGKRVAAVRALGLVQGEARAIESAEKALTDRKTAVRAASPPISRCSMRLSGKGVWLRQDQTENGVLAQLIV